MREAGIRLRQPAETKEEGARGEKEEGCTQGEEFTQESVIEVSPPPEEYNTQQYYDNYKQLVDEFRRNGGDGCNHVIYMYNLPQKIREKIQQDENDKIQIDDGNTRNAPNDCFEHIAKCVVCNRHQQKIESEDTQLHIYVPAINETTAATETASTGTTSTGTTSTGTTSTGTTSTGTTSTGTTSTGTHGGMLKNPKQRKTRKHNQKKKKRTIRKNKQQHTKRSKRTSKKKSHKKSNKK
jgi:hypothetical protein